MKAWQRKLTRAESIRDGVDWHSRRRRQASHRAEETVAYRKRIAKRRAKKRRK